jgi:hypothetical protein
MTKSKTQAGMTQRTYPMSERSKTILDQINIVTPGYTKADLVNFFIFWGATSILEIQEKNPMDIKDAMKQMRITMANYGYNAVRDNILNRQLVTQLDRFFITVDPDEE